MLLYHATTRTNGFAILRDGFRNRLRSQRQNADWEGVLLRDRPHDRAGTGVYVVIALDWGDHDLLPYERHTGSTGYREFLIPAAVLNRYGIRHLHDTLDRPEPS